MYLIEHRSTVLARRTYLYEELLDYRWINFPFNGMTIQRSMGRSFVLRSINYAVQAQFYHERRDMPLKCCNCVWRRGCVSTLAKCAEEDSAMSGDL